MHTNFENTSEKSIQYFDTSIGVTRGQCIALAKEINKHRVIRGNWDDWIVELGDSEDRTNTEALATWISRQVDIFIEAKKRDRVKALRHRFKTTMQKWLDGYLASGFEIY